jgi:hypothetical protein
MTSCASARPQFSLGTLLILMGVVGVAIGTYVVESKLRKAQRELRTLRNETGHLTVNDRSKVHVIAVDVDEPNTWRWRLFIPRGHKYSWNVSAEKIPEDDVPQKAEVKGGSNEPYWERDNEVLATARLRQGDGGDWRLSVESRIGDAQYQMAGVALQIPREKMQWMADPSCTDGRVAGSNGVAAFQPQGPIVLLQSRPCELLPDGTYGPSPHPMPGFMIWLAEEP